MSGQRRLPLRIYMRARESGASRTPPPTDELQVVRWGGTMWASSPTQRLTIEFRRGGALLRPLVDAEAFPVWTGSTSAERVAVDRRRDSAKA